MPWSTLALVCFGAGAVIGFIRKEYTAALIASGMFFLGLVGKS